MKLVEFFFGNDENMTFGKQKKMAVINDFSGFGRCSLAVSLPIISAMKIQCCSLPTAIFSNHTGYPVYFFDDYTEKMKAYYSKWLELGLEFDGIYSGFLGSEQQIETVLDFIHQFKKETTSVIIDPVMGDNGQTYSTMTPSLCRSIQKLLPYADIITPNLTEACILTGSSYPQTVLSPQKLFETGEKLLDMGCKNAVITGIDTGKDICNFIIGKNSRTIIASPKCGSSRAGTGDVFSSIIAADCVNHINLEVSVKKAADFISKAVNISIQRNIPVQDGICFEDILYLLNQ